jgi:predicted DNA-binding antitoxin AbrB/MazE fold protein
MYKVIRATYQDGVLRPVEDLPLEEQQQVVVVIILPARSDTSQAQPSPERVKIVKEQTATWLRQQPDKAVRPPASLKPAQEQRVDQDIEDTLRVIRAKAGQLSSEEIAADVSQALVEAQMISAEELARLEAELDTILAE